MLLNVYTCNFIAVLVQLALFVLGPLSNPPTLLDFLENVVTRIPADKWRDLGIALGIPPSTLDGYELRNPRRCYEAIFEEWERCSHPLKWECVLQALQTNIVGERRLADVLSKRLRTS